MHNYQKLKAFIQKDFLILSSYKMAFIITILGTIFPLVSYSFIGKLMQGYHPESLAKYGGNYSSFVLIGICISTYFTTAITEFSKSLRRSQMIGCLEAILCSQTDSRYVIFMSASFSFVFTSVMLVFMILSSVLFLGFDFSSANLPATFLALLLSLVNFISLGVLSGAGTILFKEGEPFGFVFGTLSSLLGGAVFPVAILPDWLKIISYILPINYSLDALRLSMLKGYSISMISSQLITLGIMTIILLPASLRFFNWAIERSKQDGTLIKY